MSRSLVAAAGMALALSLAGGCPKPSGGPDAAGSPSTGGVKITVTVGAAEPTGRRSASARVDAPGGVSDGQLAFQLPDGCRIVAGAAVRQLKPVAAGASTTQELAFECDAGVTGNLDVTLKGTNEAGGAIEAAGQGGI